MSIYPSIHYVGRRPADKKLYGQEIWGLVALCHRGGVRVRDRISAAKHDLHLLRTDRGADFQVSDESSCHSYSEIASWPYLRRQMMRIFVNTQQQRSTYLHSTAAPHELWFQDDCIFCKDILQSPVFHARVGSTIYICISVFIFCRRGPNQFLLLQFSFICTIKCKYHMPSTNITCRPPLFVCRSFSLVYSRQVLTPPARRLFQENQLACLLKSRASSPYTPVC